MQDKSGSKVTKQPTLAQVLRNKQCCSLRDLLNREYVGTLSAGIKKKPQIFISYLQANKIVLKDCIDMCMKNDQYDSHYQKRLASLCLDIFSGDYGDIVDLFMRQKEDQHVQNYSKEQLQSEEANIKIQNFLQRFDIMVYLLEYLHRPITTISPVCINYISKLLTQIISVKPYQLFEFFSMELYNIEYLYLSTKVEEAQRQGQSNNQLVEENGEYENNKDSQKNKLGTKKSSLNILIDFAFYFPGVSEMLAKLVAQQSFKINSKFKNIKDHVIKRILQHLLSDEKISLNTQNYENLLDFVEHVFIRNKYRCGEDEQPHQIGQITQRFVDEDVIWFFKEKLIQSALQVNLNQEMAHSSTTINSYSSITKQKILKECQILEEKNGQNYNIAQLFKKNKKNPNQSTTNNSAQINAEKEKIMDSEKQGNIEEQVMIKKYEEEDDIEEKAQKCEIIFYNSLKYLMILVNRMNCDEEVDPYLTLNEPNYHPEPTMDFHVDEAIYAEDSLYQLMTLQIPIRFSKLNRMQFYVLLMEIVKNSRYTQDEDKKQCKLRKNTLINILVHLLKAFKRQFRNTNGVKNIMIKFYIVELITEAILPYIDVLQPRQAMLVLSAFSPTSSVYAKNLSTEDQSMVFKIMAVLTTKCSWYHLHFQSLDKINIPKMKEQFSTKICQEAACMQGRKYPSKQFSFMNYFLPKQEEILQKKIRFEDQWEEVQNYNEDDLIDSKQDQNQSEDQEDVFANADTDQNFEVYPLKEEQNNLKSQEEKIKKENMEKENMEKENMEVEKDIDEGLQMGTLHKNSQQISEGEVSDLLVQSVEKGEDIDMYEYLNIGIESNGNSSEKKNSSLMESDQEQGDQDEKGK